MPFDGKEFEVELSETTKLLIAGKERIEKGWCKGMLHQRTLLLGHKYCMLGAVWGRSGSIRAASLLMECVPDKSIAQFNDARKRTKDEVLAVFDNAIQLSKAKDLEDAITHNV